MHVIEESMDRAWDESMFIVGNSEDENDKMWEVKAIINCDTDFCPVN